MNQRSNEHPKGQRGTRIDGMFEMSDRLPPLRPKNAELSTTDTGVKSSADNTDNQAVIEVEGVYIISVAARILDMHPQTLRKYEKLGLINPGRTIGMLRLYSTEYIKKVRLIRYLSDELGLNLAGVEFALAAFDNLSAIKQRMNGRLEGIPAAQQVVQEDMDLLFKSLNLPNDQ